MVKICMFYFASHKTDFFTNFKFANKVRTEKLRNPFEKIIYLLYDFKVFSLSHFVPMLGFLPRKNSGATTVRVWWTSS